jgi:hypothetical protein
MYVKAFISTSWASAVGLFASLVWFNLSGMMEIHMVLHVEILGLLTALRGALLGQPSK